MTTQGHQPTLEVFKLCKAYGGIPVLRDVDITLLPGEIHAVAGGNGAGKSTLMKILTGVVHSDSGEIHLNGSEVRFPTPASARNAGMYMVPQEPQLFGSLSVLENITLCLGKQKTERSEIEATAKTIASHIDLNATADELSISDQQLVEIIRGVLRKASVLIVDEPTAALTVREVEELFRQLRTLAATGVGIFYVTHRLNEIFELCDRVTVLRDGLKVLTAPTAETTMKELVEAMVPGSEELAAQTELYETHPDSEPALRVQNLSGQGFSDVSLEVYPGEVLGIAGLVGAGRTELAETIYGLRPQASGSVLLGDAQYEKRSPRESLAKGLAYVPEDRHAHGVFLGASIIDNTTVSILPQVSTAGVLNSKAELKITDELTTRLALQAGAITRLVGHLSGGNQQKISLAKALACEPRLIILDEPSRGVDVGARKDLYKHIRALAADGCAVLVISSDFEEIVDVCDRICVMRLGRVTAEIAKESISLASVRDACFGLDQEENA